MDFIQVSENKFALTTCESLSLLVKVASVAVASVAVADPGVKARHLLVRSSVARVGLVHSVGRGSSSVVGISGPLAVAVEPMAVAVSKAETLSRPLSGRHSMSRVDSHSSVERLSGPLAVVATIVEAGVKTRDLLVRSTEAGVGLADGVLGSKLVSVDVVAVLKSGNGTVGSIGISGPLAVSGVKLSPLLERAGSTGVRLADSVARGQFVSVDVVAVFKGGGESDSVTDAVSIRSISAPLADTVAMGSVGSGAGSVAVAGGRPGAEARSGKLVAVEGFSGGGHGQA